MNSDRWYFMAVVGIALGLVSLVSNFLPVVLLPILVPPGVVGYFSALIAFAFSVTAFVMQRRSGERTTIVKVALIVSVLALLAFPLRFLIALLIAFLD